MNHAQPQTQLSLSTLVRPEEIERKRSLGGAIELCAEVADLSLEKTARSEFAKRGLVVDKAQFSRWKDGSEGIMWSKLCQLMDICGNDAPLLWMNYDRGYDLHAMRKRETELERQVRELQEENTALKRALRA